MNTTPAIIIVALALLSLIALSSHFNHTHQGYTPYQQAIVQLACDYPTDGVLQWAQENGLTVNLQEDC